MKWLGLRPSNPSQPRRRLPEIKELVYQPAGDILHLWAAPSGRPSVNEYVSEGVYAIVDVETGDPLGFEIVEFRRFVENNPKHFASLWPRFEAMWKQSDEIVVRLNTAGQAEIKDEVKRVLEYA